jgi:hypothetical protein
MMKGKAQTPFKEVPIQVPSEFELNPKAQTITLEEKYSKLY